MVRKALALLVVAAIVGVTLGAVGLLWPTLAGAQAPASALRSFSPPSVAPGGEVEVTVTVGGYGAGGRVEETLPAGFSYVDGSAAPADIRVTLDGQTVRFTMTETTEFTYKVSASSTEGDYTFNGVLKDLDRNSYPVGGASTVTVQAGAVAPGPVPEPDPTTEPVAVPHASRSFSPPSVAPGGEVEVTVTVGGYGAGGRVEETLPAGFSYVDGSAAPADIRVTLDGQTVRFTMTETTEFTYKVSASSTEGDYTFNGVLKDLDRNSYPVGGASTVTVQAGAVAPGPVPEPDPTTEPVAVPHASRSFSPLSVAPGGELEVTVTVGGYGAGGRVEETLPAGFSYVDGSAAPADIRVTLDGQTVRFTMTETTEFTYKVSASSTEGDYTFNGVLKDLDRNSYPVGGASRITVGPNASRSFSMTMTGLGDEVTVTITAMNYGQIGAVVETIPMGFTYVMGSSDLAHVEVEDHGMELRFALLDPNNTIFMYTVKAPSSPGSYVFKGRLFDDERMWRDVGGDMTVMVQAPAAPPPPPPPPRRGRWWWRWWPVRPSGSQGDAHADSRADDNSADGDSDA